MLAFRKAPLIPASLAAAAACIVVFAGSASSAQDPAESPAGVTATLIDGLGADSPDGRAPVKTFSFPAERFPLDLARASGHAAAGSKSLPMHAVSAPVGLAAGFVLAGELPEGDTPADVAFTADGTRFIIAHRDSRNLTVFDAATQNHVMSIPLSGSPNALAVSSDGVHAVTANIWEDTASIVDLAAGAEIALVPVGNQPGAAGITPDGATAVIGNTVDSTLSVIDIASALELRRIPNAGFVGTVSINFEPGAIATSFSRFAIADNATVVHPDYYNNRIQIFDITTGATTTLASAASPRGVAVTPSGLKAVVAHAASVQKLTVIDVPSKSILKTISTGVDLWGPLAIRPDGVKAAVGVQNACRIVDLTTDAVSGSINTASVSDLLTTADGLYVLGVGYYGSLIDYASATLVKNLNGIVSTSLGAVSPAGPRAVLAANTFGEDMVVVNTNGSSGYTEGTGPTGAPPEGDKARTMAFSPDGTKAVVVNIFSDNASIIDLATGAVAGFADVGDRPAEPAVTPDGAKAVVANLDSYFTSVIDLTTYAVTNISMGRRGSEVEIAPDGGYAYVAVVADGDGVYRINLDTLALEGAKLATGDMGAIGFMFSQTSGMTLSHDGATLAVCGSFTDQLTLIDTAAWSVAKTLTVGDFPVRAVFSADDGTVYATNRDSDSISVVANAGAGSAVTDTIPVGDYPFEMTLDPGGAVLYVLNFNAKNVGVVDLTAGAMTATIPLPNSPAGLALSPGGGTLYAATGTWSVALGPGPLVAIAMDGELCLIDTATTTLYGQIETGMPPSLIAALGGRLPVAMTSPLGDGLVLVFSPHLSAQPK